MVLPPLFMPNIYRNSLPSMLESMQLLSMVSAKPKVALQNPRIISGIQLTTPSMAKSSALIPPTMAAPMPMIGMRMGRASASSGVVASESVTASTSKSAASAALWCAAQCMARSPQPRFRYSSRYARFLVLIQRGSPLANFQKSVFFPV